MVLLKDKATRFKADIANKNKFESFKYKQGLRRRGAMPPPPPPHPTPPPPLFFAKLKNK